MPLEKKRIIQFDVLRIIAAFAVVWLHTSGQRFYDCYPSDEWDARNCYDSLVRWAVPAFVMISGALFLDPQKKIKIGVLYAHNITRIVLVFLFWSFVYCAYAGIGGNGFVDLLGRIIRGPFHFWFLKMLIGLYISVPILRAIVANKQLEQYFLCLSIATTFFIPMVFPIIGYISEDALSFVIKYYEGFEIRIAVGNVGYFVLGHYLINNNVKEELKRVVYILGLLSVAAVGFITYYVSNRVGEPYLFFYEDNNLFTFFEAVALFIFIKDVQIAPKYHAVLISASKLSLSVYILHPLVMNILFDCFALDSASLNPIYFIPIYTLIVFMVSCCLSFVLIRIPIIKRFLM